MRRLGPDSWSKRVLLGFFTHVWLSHEDLMTRVIKRNPPHVTRVVKGPHGPYERRRGTDPGPTEP